MNSVLLKRAITVAALTLVLVLAANAGGPLYVAGVGGFRSGLAGTPIGWAGGVVRYYTDLGDLSPVLPQGAADALVADAFGRWTSVPTAALSAIREGQLAEDVSGMNVSQASGALVMPVDIQPGSSKPLAVVYDADGQVTDALLGAGAGAPELCSTNSAFGAADAFTEDAHIAHALVVINGNCAQNTADVPVLRYRLVRLLGSVLGLDWSQLNDNILTGASVPTFDDYAGWPLMHPVDIWCGSSPIACVLNPEQPRMDDVAALSRLYPVTSANTASFGGKQLFAETTARVSGTVRFADPAGQGMQGVNVVARLIDPATGRPSRRYAASCVSGFLFRGNEGNAVTGYVRPTGERFDRFGSNDLAKQGWFELAGLEVPAGTDTAQYEISVEPINPLYDSTTAVGPYREGVVALSGTAQPVIVTIKRGGEVVQDMLMAGSAADTQDNYEPNTFAAPAEVPAGGDWIGSLSPYGDEDYHWLTLRANRTVILEVTAQDEKNVPSTQKSQPVIGLWREGDVEGSAPFLYSTPFNAVPRGMTRLSAQIIADGKYKMGVADLRGDGRPDFRYRARVLYGDTVSPARVGVLGGAAVTIHGLGFRPGITVTIGGIDVPAVVAAPTELQVTTPPLGDGLATIAITDPITGATATMIDALAIGALPTDKLVLVAGANPGVPVGTQAPNPIRVRVVDQDGSPVAGASVTFRASPAGALEFPPCASETCTFISDATGEVSASFVVKQVGVITATASLPSGVNVSTTISGVSSTVEIAATVPRYWVAAHAATTLPLTVRVIENGVAAAGRTVNYQVMYGNATLGSTSATTAANGEATVDLSIPDLRGDVQVSACVAEGAPCTSFVVLAVAPESLKLEKLSGDEQVITLGQALRPISVRVTDSSVPANAVLGATVKFDVAVFRLQDAPVRTVVGEAVITHPAQPAPLASSETVVVSDASGVASFTPSFDASLGAIKVTVRATAGNAAADFAIKIMWPTGN